MNRVEFRKSVRQGVILRFEIQLSRRGNTSVQYEVVVYADDPESGVEESIFTTSVSFVCLWMIRAENALFRHCILTEFQSSG